jgi:hypothetical protein
MSVAYSEFVDFVVAGASPQRVIDFHPSDETKVKVAELIRRQKAGLLSADEIAELNHYLEVEHLMRLAKARARERISGG